MMAVCGISFRSALETLAADFGVIVPKWEKNRTSGNVGGLKTIWEQNRNDARMTMVSLVLVCCRFVPGCDGVDFREADIETTRRYAGRLMGCSFHEIVEMFAVWRCEGDVQQAWVVLECLYFGRSVRDELWGLHLRRLRQFVQWDLAVRRRAMLEEVEREIERMNRKRKEQGGNADI